MVGLEQIDNKPKDQNIDVQEIQDGLKPGGFFDSNTKKNPDFDKNMTALKKELDDIALGNEYLEQSLKDSLDLAKMDISQKIKENKDLSPDDIKILKLAMFVENKKTYTAADFANLDWKKDVIVSEFIYSKNPFYKAAPITAQISKKSSIEVKMPESSKTKLPNIDNFGSAKSEVILIENRYKSNFPDEYSKLKESTQSKSDYYDRTHTLGVGSIISPIHLSIHAGDALNSLTGGRGAKEKIEYNKQENKYMMLLQIIYKYVEAQQNGIDNILKGEKRDEKKYKEEFDYYMSYCTFCADNQQLSNTYQTQKKEVEAYGKGVEALMNKCYKGDEKLKKSDEIAYNGFQNEINDKYENPDMKVKLEKANIVLSKDVSTLEGGEDIQEDIDFFLQYINDMDLLKEKYGSEKIDRYTTFNGQLMTLYNKNKQKIEQFKNTEKQFISKFSEFDKGKERIDKFQSVFKKVNACQKNINFALGNYEDKKNPQSGVLENLVNSSPEFHMLYKAGRENVDPEAKQKNMNERLESQSTFVQISHTIGSSIANVGTRFIGGIGDMWTAGFSMLPLGDTRQNSVACARYIWNEDIINPMVINQSTLQSSQIIQDGRFDSDKLSLRFWEAFDGKKVSGSATTWVSQSTTTIGNMLLLICGGKSLGGRSVGINIGKLSLTGTTGLLKMSMLMSVGPSFEKYKNAGFDPQTAGLAAFLEGGIVAGMELINVGPYFQKNTIKTLLSKKGFIATILKDLGGENIQELSQSGAEKGMEILMNNVSNLLGTQGHVDVSFSLEEIANTIILTTIATLAVSSPGNIKNVQQNNKSYAYYDNLRKNPILAENLMNFINLQKGKTIDLFGLPNQLVDDTFIQNISTFLKIDMKVNVPTSLENQTNNNSENIETNNIEFAVTTESTSKNQLNIPLDIQKINSLNSDNLINQDNIINPEAQSSVEQFLREQKVLGEGETLSDAQIRKIYEVHKMERKSGETDDVQLNIRKGRALRELFTEEQSRALMEGKICGKTEADVLEIEKPNIDIELENKVKLSKELGVDLKPSDLKFISMEMINNISSKLGRNISVLRSIIKKGQNKGEIQNYNNMIKKEAETVSNIIGKVYEKIDNIKPITEEINKDIINEIYPQIKDMDGNVQIRVISQINLFINKIITIEKYLNKPEYINNPKQLLADARGLSVDAIQGNITVERSKSNLIFYVDNQLDYVKLFNVDPSITYKSDESKYVSSIKEEISEGSGGVFFTESKILELKGTIVMIDGNKSDESLQRLVIHENRHGLNSLLFRGIEGEQAKIYAKDEIIAYMKEGRAITEIARTLTDPDGHYTFEIKKDSPEWNAHIKEVKIALNLAHEFKAGEIPNYLNLLAITPISGWSKLESKYHKEIQKMKNQKISILKELGVNIYQFSILTLPIESLKQITKLKSLGLIIDSRGIQEFCRSNELQKEKGMADDKIAVLQKAGIQVYLSDLTFTLSELDISDVNKIVSSAKIKKLIKSGQKISVFNVRDFNELTWSVINKISALNNFGIQVDPRDLYFLNSVDISKLDNNKIQKIKILRDAGVDFNLQDGDIADINNFNINQINNIATKTKTLIGVGQDVYISHFKLLLKLDGLSFEKLIKYIDIKNKNQEYIDLGKLLKKYSDESIKIGLSETKKTTNPENIETNNIEFTMTTESTSIKELDMPQHAEGYKLKFGEKGTDGIYHYSYENLVVGQNNLTTYLGRNGMILDGEINTDGTFTVIAKNGEKIVFNKSVSTTNETINIVSNNGDIELNSNNKNLEILAKNPELVLEVPFMGYETDIELFNRMYLGSKMVADAINNGDISFEKTWTMLTQIRGDIAKNKGVIDNQKFYSSRLDGILSTDPAIEREMKDYTPMNGKYETYKNKAEKYVQKKVGENAYFYEVTEKIPTINQNVKLTVVSLFQGGEFVNTRDEETINLVKEYISYLYNDIAQNNYSKDILIQKVAELHWWSSHIMLNSRGSALVTDAMIKGLFISKGFHPTMRKSDIAPDLEALTMDKNDFVKEYENMMDGGIVDLSITNLETNPEIINETIFKESTSLEQEINSIEKELNTPVEETVNDNIPFADKASKFDIFMTKVNTYTESIKKLTSQKNILTEKISVFINNNLQKTKDILLVRPNHIIKEINHIKGEIVGYTGSLKNSSGFLIKSALTIGLIRESIHPLVEAGHKIENVLNILHGTYDHIISEGLSVAIESVNMGLLSLESDLIRIDTNIKTKRIGESFMVKIEGLDPNTQSPNEYISSLYDIIIENPEFGYDTQDIAHIKNIINNIDITKPITENTHNEIIDYLFKNIQPKIIEKSSKIDNSVEKTEIDISGENTESNKKEEIHSELVKNTYNKIIQEITMDIKEGNNVEKNTYILASMENLSKTSRTAQGILDASASDNKQFKFENITPEEAGVIALENFQKLSEYIYINKDMQFLSVEELQGFVENIAKKTNEGILKPEYFMRDENPKLDEKTGKPKYAYTDKDGLDTAFNQFIVEFYDKLNNPATNPIELASRVEYRVNLKDHFFADGCGKTSILLSNFVLMRYGEALPQIRDGKERFKFSGQTQRDVSRPEYNPDLETWTEYYKTLFTMNKINNCKNIQEINTFISDYNKNNTSAIGKELIIGNKKIIKEGGGRSVDYYFITAEGKLETKRIENYVMDKVKEAATPDKIDQFIKEYNKNSPAKSQEAILGIYEGYCFVRGSENGEISRIKLNKNDVAPSVDFTKMSGDEILVYSIENADNLIGKYSESLKSKNEEFVVDVDGFRQFIGANEKVIAEKTHGGASFLADYYFDKIIENNKGIEGKNNTIRFVGGGAGSGKSLTSSEEFGFHGNFNGVRDGTMKTYNNAKFKIDKAIDAGFDVKIDFVFREMNAARNNGVLKRAVEQNLKMRIGDIQDVLDGKYNNELSHIDYVGRTLPIHVFYTAHVGSRETFRLLHQNGYADKIRFFNGSNVIDGIGNFQNLCNNDKFNFELGRQTATSLYEKGFISEAQYNDLIPQK